MKTTTHAMIRIVSTVAALLLLSLPVGAVESLPGKISVSKLDQTWSATGSGDRGGPAPVGEDRQLAVQRANFQTFARVKIQEMNSNHILSRARMRIDKGRDGLYRAFFHEIDDTSLTYQVSRSQSNAAIPFVAVLSYQERIYATSCATPEDCRRGQFVPVEVIPNRHIFVYNNGSWQ